MWPESRSVGFCVAGGSPLSDSRPARPSSSSSSSTMPTQRVSPSQRSRRSPKSRACSDRVSGRRSPHSSTVASSRLWTRAVQRSQPGIGSRPRSVYGPLGSPYDGDRYGPLGMQYRPDRHGLPSGHEVRTTHVDRSAVPWRALPGATRSLRSLVCSRMDSRITSTIGRLAGRCPCGEQAQREVTLAARKGVRAPHHLSRWSRSCRLPAALADDGEQEGTRLPRTPDGRRGGRDLWGLERRVQYARGVAG